MTTSEIPGTRNNGMHFFGRKSIGFKLITSFIVVIVVVLLAISAFSVARWKSRTLTTFTNKGETMAKLLARSARSGIVSGDPDQLRDAAAGFAAVRDVLFVGIYDRDRNPLYLSDPAFPGSAASREERGNAGSAAAVLKSPGTLEFLKPVVLLNRSKREVLTGQGFSGAGSREQVIGYARVVLGRESLGQELRITIAQNAVMAVIFIGASIIIVFLWVRKITSPLEILTGEIRALGKGHEVDHVPVDTMDEIGRLARAFNGMLDDRKVGEQTRKNILRDLHDGVGGLMTNIIILSEITRTKPVPDEVTRTLATISALSREGIDEIRNLIYSLDRHDLHWSSLIAEMRGQGNRIIGPHAIAFEMTSEVVMGVAEPGSLLCLHLFKIYRESLTNVIKHAQATKINVRMTVGSERILLTVQDNGRGFSSGGKSGEGRGIINMRSRAAELGGSVMIDNSNGTCVSVEIPFPPGSGLP